MYDGFSRLYEGLLEHQDAQLVILSNGLWQTGSLICLAQGADSPPDQP